MGLNPGYHLKSFLLYLDFNFAGLSSFHHVRWDKLLGPPGPGLQSTLDKVTDTTKAVKIMQNTFIFVRLSFYKGVSLVETLIYDYEHPIR